MSDHGGDASESLVAALGAIDRLVDQGRVDDAATLALDAIRQLPGFAILRAVAAQRVMAVGRQATAVELLATALEIDAGNEGVLLIAADVLRRAGDPEPAMTAPLMRLARRVPDGWDGASELLFVAGQLADRAGNSEVAERLLTVVAQDHPERPRYAIGLARLYDRSGRTNDADSVLRRALNDHPDSAELQAVAKGRS